MDRENYNRLDLAMAFIIGGIFGIIFSVMFIFLMSITTNQ